MGLRGRTRQGDQRDSVLSHFVTTLQTVSKVWVESPERSKQCADELTQMRMKEVKETVAQFVKDKRNQIKIRSK